MTSFKKKISTPVDSEEPVVTFSISRYDGLVFNRDMVYVCALIMVGVNVLLAPTLKCVS